ncbi:Response regulator receiver protein (fragment) [Burkholderia sp. 8Y]
MPEMNGFELAVSLRQCRVTSDIGMIAFTALAESAVRARAAATSFDAYCQKAGAPTMLSRLIRQMLKQNETPSPWAPSR